MDAGRLRQRLTFQLRVERPTDLGGTEGDWKDVCTVAARVAPVPPKKGNPEQVMAMRLTGTVLYEVTVRASTATRQVTSDCRAVDTRPGLKAFGGRPFANVRSVVNVDEKDQWLTLLVESGVADG